VEETLLGLSAAEWSLYAAAIASTGPTVALPSWGDATPDQLSQAVELLRLPY